MINAKLAKIFRELAVYLDMRGVDFKPRAYEKIAEAIDGLSDDLAEIYRAGGLKSLEEIPGVGKSSAEKIEEYIKTGRVKDYETLKKEIPVNLDELLGLEGLGPRKIKHLYDALGIRDLSDLKKALAAHKIKSLEGFGEKSETNLSKGIEFIEKSGHRYIWSYAEPIVIAIKSRLEKLKSVDKVIVAGSFRRHKETIGDADILVSASNSKIVMDYFVKMPEVISVIVKGETKSSVKLESGMNVDARVVEPESYGAALNYFTGSKDHNVRLRQIAIDKGLKLNEYGLWRGKKMVAGASEEEVYKALGLVYIEPELRENTGEIELAAKNKLPDIIEYGTIMGDLQVQTNWTDGAASIYEMATAAIKLGRKYIAITDHTAKLGITNGLDEKRLKEQIREIDMLNDGFRKRKVDFRILKGIECDILKDGQLYFSDEILAQLDVVGVSIHSNFNLPREEQTERAKRAMSNPHADIFFHPTTRHINKRPECDIDMDEIIRHAKATGTVLEIDAFPDRSDLSAENIRKCVQSGVKMSIDSDAHAPQHLGFIEWGISQARRGWAKRSDIINAWPAEKMLNFLKH